MHVHLVVSRSMAVLSLTLCMLHPFGVQAQSGAQATWVISSLHPDPTPALGAPDAEFIALHAGSADPSTLDTLSTDGLVLSWNGHERTLPPGSWPAGSTVVVHRASDSVEFSGWAADRIGLSSWPALVNGGARVALFDSAGVLLDAVLYDEAALSGGGRPLLRKDPSACGAMVNFQPWSAPADPFEPLNEPLETGHVALTSDALKTEAERVERLIIRGPGRLEWRLPGPVDPRSMLEAEWRIGGGRGPDPVWPSDSVVLATWTERVASAPDAPSGQGMPVRLGPLKGCASGSQPFHLTGHWTVLPSLEDVRVVGLLADPLPGDPFQRTEFVRLYNASDRTVDAGGWHWGSARLTRRRLMAPGETHRFEAGDFEDWPGLANAGGTMQITTPGGHPVASFSWSPCSHSFEEFDGRGMPLARGPATGSDWHTEGHPSTERSPHVIGYGCPRDWTGQVHSVEVYLSSPAGFLREVEWSWIAANGEEVPMVDEAVPDAPNAIRLSRPGGEAMAADWPIRTTLIGRTSPVEGGAEAHRMEGWTVEVSCPPVPLPDSVELRVAEALWAAEDGGGEFVEVENRSPFPVDLRGVQATKEVHPLPSDWDEWVEGNRSLVLQAGDVMAFGRCPRWYRMAHGGSGPACWPVGAWSALPDEEGQLSLRLPSQGPEVLDSVSWHGGMQGPWWWKETGWSWRRLGPGPQEWTPSSDGGSPGRINRWEPVDCAGHDAPLSVVVGQDGVPALRWRFPSAGHGALLRMVRWPEGTIVHSQSFDLQEQEGEWTWDGKDAQGVPAPPGGLIWDVRWWGRTCRGRWRERVRVPGGG